MNSPGDPWNRSDERLNHIVPADPNQAYDMREIIKSAADNQYFYEIHRDFARTRFRFVVGPWTAVSARKTRTVTSLPRG